MPKQIPQAARLGLVEQDVHSETLTETPAQHGSVEIIYSFPLGRKLPTNRTPRRAAELSARKGNLEKERMKGKKSLQAVTDTKICPCTATQWLSAQPICYIVFCILVAQWQRMFRISRASGDKCCVIHSDTETRSWNEAWEMSHYSGPWDGLEWLSGSGISRDPKVVPVMVSSLPPAQCSVDLRVLAALVIAASSTQNK